MSSHTRRRILRGAALAAAGSVVGGYGLGHCAAPAQAATRGTASEGSGSTPFLEGAFAPVTEELTAFGLEVTGRVPHDLDGRYLRTGPNALGIEDPRAHHWMLGDGMVHGVRLRDGRAEWYRNRWVRSSLVARKLGEPYPGEVPPDDFACNTHVIPYKGRILTLQESGPLPYELDGELNTLRPYDGRVRSTRVDDLPQEFPRVNESLVSRRHRFAYTASAAEMWHAYETVDGVPPDDKFTNCLVKHDMLRGSRQVHRFPNGAAAGEPVFVPRRGARDEDDGYLLSYVHDPHRGASDLVILSAQDFNARPLARVHLPGRVPLGFHGSWVPDA
ncbi:carotenoid oxygenase family protein [Streptomyces sp. NPDC056255]|uniref:carotenoid oxygenase family protein n=1 Tax=Streptomyces sp. NPDC056255 TaxID=3345764 RepID=UPI0035DDEA86